jgi:DNA-binding NarL/FixJ family response regulator
MNIVLNAADAARKLIAMATIPVNGHGELLETHEAQGNALHLLRVIVADSQAIFRAGLRKIFAVEDDIRVVGQAETLPQVLSAAKKFSADILIMEAALSPNPADTVSELLRQTPSLRLVVVTAKPHEELTLELFRRGAYGIVSRDVDPELFVDCLRKVSQGDPWLDSRGIQWVLGAYRTQGSRPVSSRSKIQLTPKESLIVSCVTQGMKNKEIAVRVGTTEQVVKNYLRKVYDKLGVADRLELALYCLHNHLPETPEKDVPVETASVTPAGLPLLEQQTHAKPS